MGVIVVVLMYVFSVGVIIELFDFGLAAGFLRLGGSVLGRFFDIAMLTCLGEMSFRERERALGV